VIPQISALACVWFLARNQNGQFPPWSEQCRCHSLKTHNNTELMKTYLKLIGLPLLAVTLLSAAGCRTTPQGDRTAGRVLDDKMVTGKVEQALDSAPVYKFDNVKVSTYQGVVQLSGWVATQDQKAAAERIARDVQGIHRIENNISVHGNTREAQGGAEAIDQGVDRGREGINNRNRDVRDSDVRRDNDL